MEPSGKDLSALQTTSSRNQCCLATRDKSPDSNFLRDTACLDSLEMRELQGPVTGTCPCSNADFPCYAYYTAGILDCLDFGETKPVCKQMRVSMHHRDSFSRMLRFEAIDVPVSESTASRLPRTVPPSAEPSVATSAPQQLLQPPPPATLARRRHRRQLQALQLSYAEFAFDKLPTTQIHQRDRAGQGHQLKLGLHWPPVG